jgi:hypothetical protein
MRYNVASLSYPVLEAPDELSNAAADSSFAFYVTAFLLHLGSLLHLVNSSLTHVHINRETVQRQIAE